MRIENIILNEAVDNLIEKKTISPVEVRWEGFSATLSLGAYNQSIFVEDLRFAAGTQYLGEIVNELEILAVKYEKNLFFTKVSPELEVTLRLSSFGKVADEDSVSMVKSLPRLVMDRQELQGMLA